MHLPQEYWRKQTLFEISSGVGTPLIIDDAIKSRLSGIYARILVDIDMSGHSIQQCKKIGSKQDQKDREFGKQKQQLKHPQIAKKQIGNSTSK
ncbi:hypothetical protein Pmar_PMAR016934 [Perkinsus marinus ATCC 50983]|uniref:Uncharacterized protein n=1 Tax=Perkinsus marinus (strain ATCC 50983 / TXsc) TaxID=423536 RepID=C5LLM5_PERM5|nr:hypothetical protein Pmar_PMAR016934 [Perkinsus marinus ATCC 50983]EER02368.1 hypothetical protein Pmar_PMAR016934 [Perkinsus marinus ATCC 50983]|eukprot:XP_002769650.1 hypothetical protein Pmar_PMAR016934 [Perkinsus marinus ATCC 50983]